MDWMKTESTNYIFNYHEGSTAEKEIQYIIDTQETCFNFICNCLDIKMKTKIKYYLCLSSEEVGELYGDNEPCNGFAREPDEIYAVYNEKIRCIGFHEDAHIISYNLAIPPQTFLREGLAMFFDRVSLKIPNYIWVKYFIDNNMLVKIEDLLINKNFYKFSDLITYPIAGAFVEYLILSYGIEKFKMFYCSINEENIAARFLEIYDRTLHDANKMFIKYINCMGSNTSIFSLIKKELISHKILQQ
jgi:hypothetical protein